MTKEEEIIHAFMCTFYDLGEINWNVIKDDSWNEYVNNNKKLSDKQIEDIKYLYDSFIEIHENNKITTQ